MPDPLLNPPPDYYVVRIPAAALVKGTSRFHWFTDGVRNMQGRPIVGELATEVDENMQPTGYYLMSKGTAEDHAALELAQKPRAVVTAVETELKRRQTAATLADELWKQSRDRGGTVPEPTDSVRSR